MEILKKYWLVFMSAMIVSSCTKDRLSEVIYNPLDVNSGEEIFIVDSLVASTASSSFPFVKGYFHIREELFKDPSIIKNVVVYEHSIHGDIAYTLASNQRSYFFDINVSNNNSYEFSFGLKAANGDLSKKSRSYSIFVP
ncbi:MAG: hypothetical protein IPP27_00365 [Bacteroidetes bacterium]|nr:hypothetical protein [Bacteroidota bacterium]MBP6428561.1 hypothetical protein [Bacteroidia bacterium]MBK8364744.1 hypothetical protein [Bacteroidota bacterium]MBK9414115.1 hypothetical protein [Bacteroidota bacterium]MBL0030675.1 hypothetical protein [Bacteroidota bacterium]